MTTICCISDCHLGYRHRLKVQRLRDYERAFNQALDAALALSPDLLIFGGDIFHHTRPDPRSMQVLVKRLMTAAEKVPCVFSIGNHEIETGLGSSYTPIFSDLHSSVHVLTSENPHVVLELGGKKVGVHGFQYTRDRKMAEEALEKTTSEVSDCDLNILALHQAIEGYLEPHELSVSTLREIAPKYDLILSGHVHRHQKITEVSDLTPAYYIGSTERVSFNEADNENGILVFKDFDFKNPTYVPVESASMRCVKADLGEKTPAEINEAVKQLIEENKDAKCLQVTASAEVAGDCFDVRSDWDAVYPDFTVLDVSVLPKSNGREVSLERMELNEGLFDEYFEKTGLDARRDLLELCKQLFSRYGA